MLSQPRQALVSLGLFTLLTGVLYPCIVTGLAQVLFPGQANGSIIIRNGQAVGSELIASPWMTRNISGDTSQRRALRPIARSMPRS
jgi:K+-transporting ATPase c subunit